MIIKYSNILKNALIFSISCFSLAASAQTSKYDEAMIQIEQLNRIKANEILTQLLATNPGNSAAQYQAGLIDVYFNKHQEAKAHFNSVIQLEGPEKLDATFELSKLISNEGKKDEALVLLNSVIDKNTSNDKALFERAKIKISKEDFKGANEDLTSAILHNSSDYLYFYHRGITFVELEQYPSAIQDLDKVVANVKTDIELENAYFYRGSAYYQEAIDPKYKGHKALLEKALADFDKCISIDKKDEAAYYNRGEVNMALSHYIKAISDFKHAILLNPENYDAHYNKAICNYHFGESKSAMKEMELIINKNPVYSDAYFQLGVWNYEFGDNKKSIELFSKLIEIESAHSDAFLYRGYAYLEQENTKGACADWKVADELGDKEAHKDLTKYCSSSK